MTRAAALPAAFPVSVAARAMALAAALTVSGCATSGGLASAGVTQPLAERNAIMSAMQGGLVGGTVGEDLSRGEKSRALEAEYRALESTPSGQKVAWKGSDAGRFGEVTAGQPYRVGSQDCRQYSQTVFTEAGSQTARGTACRNADGSWTPLT